MSTPVELREEMTKATFDNERGNWWVQITEYPRGDDVRVIGKTFDDGTSYDVTDDLESDVAEHIAHWDPAAAGKVLDLLSVVFGGHRMVRGATKELCIGCVEPWPFPDYTAAVAVLDQLDGGSTQ